MPDVSEPSPAFVEAWLREHGFVIVEPDEFGGRSWRWTGKRFQFSVDAEALQHGLPDFATITVNAARWRQADEEGICVNCRQANGPLSPSGCCTACEKAIDDFAATSLKDFRDE